MRLKKKKKADPEIPTSALPDIIFMLLFFFMVSTVLRETELLVDVKLPKATQIEKIEKKSLVSYIYIGAPQPKYQDKYGTEPRIQMNDVIIQPRQVQRLVLKEKDKLKEEADQIIMSLKVDKDAKMGIVIDVREQLRDADALRVNYSSSKPNSEL
ncbi:MAG: biopolymer transporter ExbD [Bernardetiaceae bacterium]|nr:biopolymer transporter ExbD [Bernardetiaceae bacterium]